MDALKQVLRWMMIAMVLAALCGGVGGTVAALPSTDLVGTFLTTLFAILMAMIIVAVGLLRAD